MNGNRSRKASSSGEERLLIILVAILVALVLLIIVGGAFLYYQFREGAPIALPPTVISSPPSPVAGDDETVERRTILVYFLSPAYLKLVGEPREIMVPQTLARIAKTALEALCDGPQSSDLKDTVPKEAKVLATFHEPNEKRLYVDLNASFYRHLPGHTLSEWAAIYSVVNTVCALSNDIESVVFLEEGKPVEQSPGNWSWRGPFFPDLAWTQYTAHGEES